VPICPLALRSKALNLAHNHPLSNHQGVQATISTLASRTFWPGLARDVDEYIRQCPQCQQTKTPAKFNLGRFNMETHKLESQVFSEIWCDLSGPYISNGKMKYIFGIIDSLSKYIILLPTASKDASVLANLLIERVVCQYGIFRILHGDNDKSLVSGHLLQSLATADGATWHLASQLRWAAR